MGLISWLSSRLGKSEVPLADDSYNIILGELMSEIHIREVAFWSTINIIANAVSKCEFKTYVKGKETQGAEYYLWNVSPNKNQNSSGFIHKLIAKLYQENECLVVEQNGQLLIADSFMQTEYALYDTVFSQVTVGNFTFTRTFTQSEVLYWKLSEQNMRQVINSLYGTYSKLITYSMKAYQKSRGTKGIFNYDTVPLVGTEERKIFDSLINEKFKKFMESGDAIIPLGKGQSYTDIDSKTYASESTRDIRALIDDISDFTAKSVGVPPALVRGDVQGISDVVDQLLTFCIDPLCDMLQEEINRKRIGQAEYLKGTKTVINTKTIKHIDLFNITAAIDKLISSGCFCVNDIRIAVGDEPINEEWANRHFITKNYATVEELLESLEGGDNIEKDLGIKASNGA